METDYLVNRKVREADSLDVNVVRERSDILVYRTKPVPDVVEADLPADEVLHVLDDEVGWVDVRGSIRRC
jgi:hypothetical protein